jgi:hypothetical protein
LGFNKAFYEVDQRDRTQNESPKATKLKQNLAEKDDAILATLTLIEKRKNTYEAALKTWQRNRDAGCLPVLPFWVCRKTDTDAFQMFLRMFLPKNGYGHLGKSKELQWEVIQKQILNQVDFTASSVLGMEEMIWRRLRTVEQAIQVSQQTDGPVDEEPSTAMNT